jgi:sugar lactone lactonase YvrE
VDTLASGTIIVSNPARGLWDSARAWTVVEDLRLGSAEGDDASGFARVRALAVDAHDRIYVLDHQTQDVRVFGPDGRHVRTMGRRGDGPGEFQGAEALVLDAEDRLWVLDRQSARYSLFDTAGTFEASYPREAYFMRTGQIWGVDRSGELVDSWEPGDVDPSGPHQTGLFRFHPATGDRDSLFLPPFDRPSYEGMVRRGSTTNRFLFPVPFAPEELLSLDARGFVWRAMSGTYEVAQLSPTGDTVRLVRREYQPIPVTDEDRDRALDRIRAAMDGGELRLDPSRVPSVRPALNGMLVDDRGYLWVAAVGQAHAGGLGLDVFDPEGRYLGQVSTPMRSWWVSPRALVRGVHLYYLTTDSLDVPYVVRARIVGRK